jgi:DNA-binding CsgD family transcriptional regulator
MSCFNTQLLRICIILMFDFLCMYHSYAQAHLNANEIQKLFNNKKTGFYVPINSISKNIYSSSNAQSIMNDLDLKANNNHFRARLFILKASLLHYESIQQQQNELEQNINPEIKPLFMEFLAKSMQEAYLSGDDWLIAQTSITYGHFCSAINELEYAVTYTMNGLELNEKNKFENSPVDYLVVGEILYKIREYEESVKFSLKALKIWEHGQVEKDIKRMMWACNTTALGYHRLQMYDSAFFYYNKAILYADDLKLNVWKGIVSGNMGQIYFEQKKFDTALSLLLTDYNISKEEKLYDNAANSLQWAARTQLALGNKNIALLNVREAFNLLKKTPNMNYLRNTNQAAMEVFKSMGEYDSAFFYNTKYSALNDSLERVVALSGIAVSKARANDEKSRYSIQSLQKEKEKQLLYRNILIAAIILLGIIGFLFITRQRLKSKLQVERMQKEITSARQQLNMFTQNIVEKTSLIEKLEQQLSGNGITSEQQLLITELSQQTILTEEDWIRFKLLYEKIYPGFFNQLKQKASDITIAENRMAALIRLQLTTKQIAAMLGISVDSVHKTRQRLRNRIHLNSDVNLDEFIAAI